MKPRPTNAFRISVISAVCITHGVINCPSVGRDGVYDVGSALGRRWAAATYFPVLLSQTRWSWRRHGAAWREASNGFGHTILSRVAPNTRKTTTNDRVLWNIRIRETLNCWGHFNWNLLVFLVSLLFVVTFFKDRHLDPWKHQLFISDREMHVRFLFHACWAAIIA